MKKTALFITAVLAVEFARPDVTCTDPALAMCATEPLGVYVDSVEDYGDGVAVKFTTELAGPYVVAAYPIEQMHAPAVPLAETVVSKPGSAFLAGRFFDLSYFIVVSTTNWIERPTCFNNAYNGRKRRTMTPAEIAAVRRRTTEAAAYRSDDTDPRYSREPFDNSGYTQSGYMRRVAFPQDPVTNVVTNVVVDVEVDFSFGGSIYTETATVTNTLPVDVIPVVGRLAVFPAPGSAYNTVVTNVVTDLATGATTNIVAERSEISVVDIRSKLVSETVVETVVDTGFSTVWTMYLPWTDPVVMFGMEIDGGVDMNAVTSSSVNRATAFREPKVLDFCFTNANTSATLRGYRILLNDDTGAVLIREAYSSHPYRSEYFVVNRGFKSLTVHGGYKFGTDWKGRKYFQAVTNTSCDTIAMPVVDESK